MYTVQIEASVISAWAHVVVMMASAVRPAAIKLIFIPRLLATRLPWR
jgi:hypothetical protein